MAGSNAPVQVDAVKGTGTTLASSTLVPVANDLYVVVIGNKHASVGTPTLAGTGGWNVTWTQLNTRADAGNALRCTMFRGIPSSASSGALTASFGGVSQDAAGMFVIRCPNANTASGQGVIQAVTGTATSSSPAATLSAYGSQLNVGILAVFSSTDTTFTNSTAKWTPSLVNNVAAQSTCAWMQRQGTTGGGLEVTPTGTLGTSSVWAAVAIEVKGLASAIGESGGFSKPTLVPERFTLSHGATFLRGVRFVGQADQQFGGPGVLGFAGDPTGRSSRASQSVGATLQGYWPLLSQRDDVVAGSNSGPPSQVQGRNGKMRGILVRANAGTWTFTIKMKAEVDTGSAYRPQVIVVADPYLGVASDVVSTAVAGTDWQDIACTFTLLTAGVLEVLRYKRGPDHVRLWWDDARLSQ